MDKVCHFKFQECNWHKHTHKTKFALFLLHNIFPCTFTANYKNQQNLKC